MATLSIEEQIAIAGLEVLGKSFVTVGYLLTHPKSREKKYGEKVLYSMASRWFNTEAAKVYRKQVATKIGTIHENSGDMSNADIMHSLEIAAKSETDFKRKADILVQLAKMKTTLAEQTPEDMRIHLYLPFNSDCRQCELYHAARTPKELNTETIKFGKDVQEEKTAE